MHLRPYGPDTLLLLWEYWHGDWPVGSPPDLTPGFDVPTPGNFYVNLPPLFLGHFSPIFPRFFPIFSQF